MSTTYLTYAETRDGKLRQVALEAISAAMLCAEAGDTIVSALIGTSTDAPSAASELAAELIAYGASQVAIIEHPDLGNYQAEAYAAAFRQVIEQTEPQYIIVGHTAIGRDLAPRVAGMLEAGQISDVTAIDKQAGELIFTRPIYAGKAIEQRKFTSAGQPQIITIRPNNISLAGFDETRQGQINELHYNAGSLRALVQDVVKKTSGKIDLSEAKIIVSGGRGVKSANGFKPLEELAEVLNGAVGASRGACDAGYCDYGLQIGQTGKVVTPEIYIACGISGAIQHLAGMSGSRVIIAINKDPEAPIFKVADYGIVGDLFEVVPLLSQEFKKLLQ